MAEQQDVAPEARREFLRIQDEQNAKGLAEYHVPLRTHNSLDALQCAASELVDAFQYVTQARMENAALRLDLAAAREREHRLMTRLRCAERNTLYQDTDLDWCRICDQTAPPGEAIDHAPDCPFAAAAPSAEAQESRGEGVSQ